MVHDRMEFEMPAPPEVVFDAFHYHEWRAQWDSLVSATHVVGGAPCPYVGAFTENTGGGLLRGLAMRTQFVSFDRPRLAAAVMRGRSFPFVRWAASMRHRPQAKDGSWMIYTYSFVAGPPGLRWLVEPIVKRIFDRQTYKRFVRMQAFLANNGHRIVAWQERQGNRP